MNFLKEIFRKIFRRKKQLANHIEYKEFKEGNLVARIYKPQSRTIFYLGRSYYLNFPRLVFATFPALAFSNLCVFIEVDKEFYLFPLGCVFPDGSICLGDKYVDTKGIGRLINIFWNTEFNEFSPYGVRAFGRLRAWEKMSPEEVRERCKDLHPWVYAHTGNIFKTLKRFLNSET